jgi:hypothetical protein
MSTKLAAALDPVGFAIGTAEAGNEMDRAQILDRGCQDLLHSSSSHLAGTLMQRRRSDRC